MIPSVIPTYASACSGIVRYSSACSCIGVFPRTITAATPVTTTTVSLSSTSTSTRLTTVATESITRSTTLSTTTTTSTTSTVLATAGPLRSCAPCSPVLQNPSFERGYGGWDFTFVADTSQVESPQPAGTAGSYGVGTVLGTNGAVGLRQIMNTVPGKAYTLKVDYWFSEHKSDCYLNAFVNGGWFFSFSPRFDPTVVGRWTTGTTSFTATSCSDVLDVQFLCTNWQSLTVRMDNLRMTPNTPFNC